MGNSSVPVIAVALLGALRLPEVVRQVRNIRSNPGFDSPDLTRISQDYKLEQSVLNDTNESNTILSPVPIVMCLDRERTEARRLANMLGIKIDIFDNDKVQKGEKSNA